MLYSQITYQMAADGLSMQTRSLQETRAMPVASATTSPAASALASHQRPLPREMKGGPTAQVARLATVMADLPLPVISSAGKSTAPTWTDSIVPLVRIKAQRSLHNNPLSTRS